MIDYQKILEIIDGLGGCDAKNEYTKGWDDAINTCYDEIAKYLNILENMGNLPKNKTRGERMMNKHQEALDWLKNRVCEKGIECDCCDFNGNCSYQKK